MNKRGLSRQAEASVGREIDAMICYLECGDYRPPVRTFVPFIDSLIAPLLPRLHAASRARAHLRPWAPLGFVFGPDRGSGASYRVAVATQLDRSVVRRLAAFGMGAVKGGRVYARVIDYDVREDGTAVPRIPTHYWADESFERDFWVPVVGATRGGAVRRRVTASGGGSQWQEYEVESSGGYGGFPPILAGAFAVVRRDVWSVRVGATNGASEALIPTDERGAHGFFNLRHKPPGSRRAALLHWVQAHTRGGSVDVAGHLRGAEEFDWMGLRCRVDPPEHLRGAD